LTASIGSNNFSYRQAATNKGKRNEASFYNTAQRLLPRSLVRLGILCSIVEPVAPAPLLSILYDSFAGFGNSSSTFSLERKGRAIPIAIGTSRFRCGVDPLLNISPAEIGRWKLTSPQHFLFSIMRGGEILLG
jgi:hypothetical protein